MKNMIAKLVCRVLGADFVFCVRWGKTGPEIASYTSFGPAAARRVISSLAALSVHLERRVEWFGTRPGFEGNAKEIYCELMDYHRKNTPHSEPLSW